MCHPERVRLSLPPFSPATSCAPGTGAVRGGTMRPPLQPREVPANPNSFVRSLPRSQPQPPARLSAVTTPNQPKEGPGSVCFGASALELQQSNRQGRKCQIQYFNHFPQETGQDIISDFVTRRFPEERAGKRRRGVTALDLLLEQRQHLH